MKEQKKLLVMQRTTRSQLRKGDRPWEGRLWEIRQAMNKKLILGLQGGMRWHNTSKSCYSTLWINGTFGRRRFQCLPTEISSTSSYCESGNGVVVGNNRDDRREFSRGHSSCLYPRRAKVSPVVYTGNQNPRLDNEGPNQ